MWHNNVHLLPTTAAAAAQVACFGEEVNYYVVHNTRGLTNFHLPERKKCHLIGETKFSERHTPFMSKS